jgi:hypothetical protein
MGTATDVWQLIKFLRNNGAQHWGKSCTVRKDFRGRIVEWQVRGGKENYLRNLFIGSSG